MGVPWCDRYRRTRQLAGPLVIPAAEFPLLRESGLFSALVYLSLVRSAETGFRGPNDTGAGGVLANCGDTVCHRALRLAEQTGEDVV